MLCTVPAVALGDARVQMEAFAGAAPRGATSLAAGCAPQLLQAGPKLAPQPTGRASVCSLGLARPTPCHAGHRASCTCNPH